MSLTVNLYYTGVNGAARKFAEEMPQSGIVSRIQAEEGNLKYNYFVLLADPETILLIDSWENQAALDQHHTSPMMAELAALRDKYDLHTCKLNAIVLMTALTHRIASLFAANSKLISGILKVSD